MASGELDICCLVDPQFGIHTEQKRMGCDAITSGFRCTEPPYLICAGPEGSPCGEAGICTAVPFLIPGSTSYDSLARSYDFTHGGPGEVNYNFSFDGIGCPTAIEGSGNEDLVAGDYIQVKVRVDVHATEACGPYIPEAEPTSDMDPDSDPGYQWAFTMNFDAATGGSCGVSYNVPFSDPGWADNLSPATLKFRATVKGYHMDGSPASFAIGPNSDYAVLHSASVTGDCCAHTINFSDIDS